MNTNHKSVFGFTIGPIYELMSHSKKTRELWFSSFFFSWYVKKLYYELVKSNGIKFLKPYIDNISTLPKTKAGLFPDHIIGYSEKDPDKTFEIIQNCIKNINTFFVDLIDETGKSHYLSGKTKTDVENIFTDYLQTSFVVIPIDTIKGSNVVEIVENYLDALERNRSFTLRKNENPCFRCKSFPAVFDITDNYETKYKKQPICPFCFIKFMCNQSDEVCSVINEQKNFRYRSTGEISAVELIKKIDEEKLKAYLSKYDELEYEGKAGNEFRELLPEKGKEIRPYHKYMAIVQADGDNLGYTASSVKNPEELSQILFEFGQEALDITNKFHGEAIYIGGDDVLAFLPTAFKEGENFFTIIDYLIEISKTYKCKLLCKNLSGSISIGVHLFYYKSPLSLAIQSAREQLFNIAKKVPGKDSFSLLLTQHSGQKVGFQFKFCSDELNLFRKIMNNILSGNAYYPHGIHHKLNFYEKLLTNLSDIHQIDSFVKNRFNEDIHKTYTGLDDIKEYLKMLLSLKTSSGQKILTGNEAKKRLSEFISQLKFIKFLLGED